MLKVLVIGAHPDDCDIAAGGTAALWRHRGDVVRFVSVTNGNAGHQSMRPAELAARRRAEAAAAGAVLGIEYEVLDNDDGKLEASLERRLDMIRAIRRFAPDLVLTHRPNDYHPDHRYTSTLVLDSAYMVTVPLLCPDVPHLQANPVIAYFHDAFQKPCPFTPDIAVDVDQVMELKWRMLSAHASQFFEWLPYNDGTAAEAPQPESSDVTKLRWLERRWQPILRAATQRSLPALVARFGQDRAGRVQFAESFELSEYGGRPSAERLEALFPRG